MKIKKRLNKRKELKKTTVVKGMDMIRPKQYECASIPMNYETGGGKR